MAFDFLYVTALLLSVALAGKLTGTHCFEKIVYGAAYTCFWSFAFFILAAIDAE